MKVTTLACIQGGWLPKFKPTKALDIGAGTGLLSHMTAQKYQCEIDAVEIEADTFAQLVENTAQNPWKSTINCIHENIMDFANHTSKQYDFIISNPPFFQNQLQSTDSKINQARHGMSLEIQDLLRISAELITTSGQMSILLPPYETEKLSELSKPFSLFISNQLVIHDSEKKPPKAIVTILSRNTSNPIIEKLIIKNANGDYSRQFVALLKDYYLSL